MSGMNRTGMCDPQQRGKDSDMRYFYVGTWKDDSRGLPGKILVYALREHAVKVQEIVTGESVSQVRLDHQKRRLYAVTETRDGRSGICGGDLYEFAVEPDGMLRRIKLLPSGGAYPIDFAMLPGYLALVNHGSTTGRVCRTRQREDGSAEPYWEYDEASLVLYERDEEGSVGRMLDVYRFEGCGKIPFFQESAAPHSVTAVGNRLFVPERGTDQTSVFEVTDGKLKKCGVLAARKGSGPRNAAVSSDGRDIYVVGEIEPVLFHYRTDGTAQGESGASKSGAVWSAPLCRTVPVISQETASGLEKNPRSFKAPHPSAVLLSPDGRHVYVLTRSADMLTVFAREEESGTLTACAEHPLGGANPRAMLEYGRELYVVLMEEGSCAAFMIEDGNGMQVRKRSILENIPGIAAVGMWDPEDSCTEGCGTEKTGGAEE